MLASAASHETTLVDEAALERETTARMNARIDLSAPWTPMTEGVSYLASDDAVARDGGVDVIVHFHGAPLADEVWRANAVAALVIGVNLTGYGVAQYRDMFASGERFDAMLNDAVARVGGSYVRRLGLVSWSAGYGAVEDVLSDPDRYARVDAVVLLDGMHVDYTEGLPDESSIAIFERFARDAVAGDKAFVVTHSSITPSGYASTTETATMLLGSLGVARVEEKRTNARGMVEWYHADQGGLHVRGFRGDGARDHLDQLRLAGDTVREVIAPRWTRQAIADEKRSAPSIEL